MINEKKKKEKKRRNLQIDEGGRDEVGLGFLGLLNDGVDVVDVSDGFKNFLVLLPVEFALFFGFLDHVIVVLH